MSASDRGTFVWGAFAWPPSARAQGLQRAKCFEYANFASRLCIVEIIFPFIHQEHDMILMAKPLVMSENRLLGTLELKY